MRISCTSDHAEVHDVTSFAEVLQTEILGLMTEGEGGPVALRGETGTGGRIPVNLSRGIESKGHPLAASGARADLRVDRALSGTAGCRQADGARIALAENGGGFHRGEEVVTGIVILEGR